MEGKIELGDVVEDEITGYTGTVIADTMWLNGCRRLLLQARELKDGKPVGHIEIDIENAILESKGRWAQAAAASIPSRVPTGGDRDFSPSPTR